MDEHAIADDPQAPAERAPFLSIPSVFTTAECSEVIELFSMLPSSSAMTYDQGEAKVSSDARSVRVAFVPREPDTEWVYERMDRVFVACAAYWGLRVTKTLERINYLTYSPGHHFGRWHADSIIGPMSPQRKISLSVELGGSADYEGGDLQIFPIVEGHAGGPHRDPGHGIAFPSHAYHRVTSVTRGMRRVLVNWMSGPALR
jgi:PKHD-type hydroxylase